MLQDAPCPLSGEQLMASVLYHKPGSQSSKSHTFITAMITAFNDPKQLTGVCVKHLKHNPKTYSNIELTIKHGCISLSLPPR